jgi:hypothetical protein
VLAFGSADRQHGLSLGHERRRSGPLRPPPGSSAGAKCPPRGKTVQRWMLYRRSKWREGLNSTKKTARIAGLLYLVNGVTGFFSIIYIPGRLIVSGNAAATANNILASERLFRLGIVSELICAAEFVFLLWVLYRLLGPVNKTQASLMVILGLLQIPIMFVNALNEIAALALLRGANFLSVFDQSQRQALAMQFLNLHGDGFVVAGIFWGLWLFPFGILVFRSGFLPRILGVLLIAACFGYLAQSFTSLLLPSYEDVVYRFGGIAVTLGEPAMLLWLLIRGAKDQPLKAVA